jgi:nucleoside phosphorylase
VTRPGGGQPEVRADVVLLTALDLEYAAVRAHLTGLRTHTDANGTRYETGETRSGRCRVALGLTGPGNLAAAALTTRAVTWFRPKALVFVGVAGGLAGDVALGDVVVATRVHAYQGGKAETGGFKPRPVSWPLSHGLDQDARDVARDGTWLRGLPGDTAVHFKPLVSGEVVLNSGDGHVAEMIREYYNDAVAIDMESAGVAEAAHHNRFHETIMVRAISDRADGTKRDTDSAGWQPRAVANAAAFAVALAERIVAGPGSPPPVGVSPYRGLAAFGERDAELFFGRGEAAEELTTLVAGRRFVAVVGRSGSGKSSLVHAGLVPRLRREDWAIAAFRPLPGVPAAISLAGAMLPLLRPGLGSAETLAQRATIAGAMAGGRLTEVVGEALGEASRLLVCVDQFEELREDAARELAELLVKLATGPVPVHVVLTIRAETLDVAVHRLGLGAVAGNSVFLLGPMSAAGLREAIEAPVRSTGVSFEPGLVARILDAASDEPAALTLTQFALTRLWDEQDHGRLTHYAYDSFGGVAGALASYADQVWAERLDETQREQARRLLVQLVRPESAVRRTARGRELAPELIPLAKHLAATRLLVTGTDETGDITVDLAHAALATHWQRLRAWLAEERNFRAWQEDLRESVRRAELLRGPRLTSALRWLRTHPHGVPDPERDFVVTSRRRQRLRSTVWRGLLVIIVGLLVVAGVFAVNLERREDELADQQRRSAAGLLATEARGRSSIDPATAALLSVSAYRTSREPDVLANLAGEYLRYRDTDRMVDPGVGHISEVAVSADGRMAAVAGTRGTALMRVDGDPVVVDRRDLGAWLVALSGSGRHVAGANNLGHVEVWEQDGPTRVFREGGPGADLPFALRFDPTGERLIAAFPSGLVMWDVASGTEMTVPPGVIQQAALAANRVWFGPDGTSVVVATEDELWSWPLDRGPRTRLATLPTGTTTMVAADGRTVLTCSGRTLGYRDLTTGAEVHRRELSQACPASFETAIDHSGRFMITDSPVEGTNAPRDAMWLLDKETAAPAGFVVPAPAESVAGASPRLAATSTGPRLVSAVGTSVVVADRTAADFTPLDGWRPAEPLFSPDLRHAVARSPDGTTLYLWDTVTGAELTKIDYPPAMALQAFTDDGAYLVATDRERVEVLAVPSLRVEGTADLPQEMKQTRALFPNRFGNFCVLDPREPDQVVIVHAGLAVRLSLRDGGWVGQPLRLFVNESDLERLADTFSCRARPGHPEFAFDAGDGVEIWNLDTGDRTTLRVPDVGLISAVRFSPDGRRMAVSGFDGSMEIWDVDRRQRVGDTRRIVGANLGAHVKGFVTGDQVVVQGGGILRVWDLRRDATIADVETAYPASGVVGPDGSLMWWGTAGPTRMSLDPERWADHLCRVAGRDLTDAERAALPTGSFTGPVC